MKIAIDESGDSGLKFWRGSSAWFVVAAVVVPDVTNGCGLVCSAVSTFKRDYMQGTELHFSHNSHGQHADFFSYMQNQDYMFVAVAVDKQKHFSGPKHFKRGKRAILEYCIDKLFSEMQPYWDDPVILIDNNSRVINQSIKRHLLRLFGSRHKGDAHAIKGVVFVDSRFEPLVQLADYIAGAVRHHVDTRYDSHSYEDYLQQKGKIFFM